MQPFFTKHVVKSKLSYLKLISAQLQGCKLYKIQTMNLIYLGKKNAISSIKHKVSLQ